MYIYNYLYLRTYFHNISKSNITSIKTIIICTECYLFLNTRISKVFLSLNIDSSNFLCRKTCEKNQAQHSQVLH